MNKEQCQKNIEQYAYKIIIPTKSLSSEEIDPISQIVSDWTNGEHMLPKSPKNIKNFIQQDHSILVYAHNIPTPVGHAAITWQYQNPKQTEIGTIITHPNWRRGKSVGTIATMAILHQAKTLYPDHELIALANPASKNLFESMGAKQMNTKDVDPEAWVLCDTCPKKPIQPETGRFICCDTPYDLSPLLFPDNFYYQLYLTVKSFA